MGFPAIFYKYIIQQYFIVTSPNTVFLQYLKQIKYQMLVVELYEATIGFLTIFYKYMIQQYFIVEILLPHPLRPHLRSSEFYKAPPMICFS